MSNCSLIILCPLALLFCGCDSADREKASDQPRTALVAKVAAPEKIVSWSIGIVRTESAAIVTTEQGGQLAAVLVDVGDQVEQGQIVARLNPAVAQLRVRQAEAELRQAAAVGDLRARHLRRISALHAEASATEAELETARDEAEAAKATRDAASVGLATARHHLEQCELRSPRPGVVVERTAKLGAVLAPGATAFTIEVAEACRIDTVLPEIQVGNLKPGDNLYFRYPGGTGEASLTGISVRSAAGGSGRHAVLRVTSGSPAPGMVVEVGTAKEADESMGMRVPLAAIHQPREGDPNVLLVGAGNRLQAVPVRVITLTGSSALVIGRLAAGDLIVAAGCEFFEPGQTVRPRHTDL